MPVTNLNETVNLANLALNPPVMPQAKTNGAPVQAITAIVSIATDASSTSTWRLARLPSNAIIHNIIGSCTAQTGTTDMRIGVAYSPNKVSGATINAACFASGLTFASASRVLDGTASLAITDSAKEIWEVAGLTADPKTELDIILTAQTIGTAGGSAGFKIEYKV